VNQRADAADGDRNAELSNANEHRAGFCLLGIVSDVLTTPQLRPGVNQRMDAAAVAVAAVTVTQVTAATQVTER
jgi:hypothetical protein